MSPNTDLRTTPLHAVHEEAGATFTDFGGWQMPLKYGSELSEHRAVRNSAGLFDLSHMGEVRVTGPQSAEALDYALTARVSAVAPGRAKYSLICTEAGTILDDLIVYRLDDGEDDSAREFLVVPNAGNASSVAAALTERSVGFEATVRNESAQTALVAIQGPQAARVLAAVLSEQDAGSLPELKYYAARTATVRTGDAGGEGTGEVPVLLARTGYTGEDGFELIIGPLADRQRLSAAATAVWNALAAAGAEAGVEVLPCGLASRDSLRLEAGMPLYGNELDLGHLPAESGVGMAVPLKSKEADFVGRAALLAAREAGTGSTSGQALVALKAAGRRAARAGYAVLDGDGHRVGEVTSGIPSPTLGYPIALARVDVAHREPGTELAVDLRGKAEPFTVVELPFYRRQD